MVDLAEAMTALMSKWVISALEPREFNLKNLLRFKLASYQSYSSGNWAPSV